MLSKRFPFLRKGLENYYELFDKLITPNGAIKVFCDEARFRGW
jgi:hypothetical protein